jgi:hypothetical protein
LGVSTTGGATGGVVVLSHGTVLPWPQSQKIIVPAELSERLWILLHCLQVNQIIGETRNKKRKFNEPIDRPSRL